MTLQADIERIVKMAGTDPHYRGLVEALTTPYYECWTHENCQVGEYPSWSKMKPGCQVIQQAPETESDCKGSGRVLRPWADLPQGALAGLLSYHARGLTDDKGKRLALRLMGIFGTLDPNATAAQWWLEYLEMEKDAAQPQSVV